jgi:DNA replication and repair protein RecF
MNTLILNKITLLNWRNYDFIEKELKENINEIIGPNGSGKTNLLEAIFFGLKQYSFRINNNLNLIKNGKKASAIGLEFSDGSKVTTKLNINNGIASKQIIVDGVKKSRILRSKIPVVIFEPNLNLIITGDKNARRDLIDGLTSIYSPVHTNLLKNYKRALAQRNNILKRNQRFTNKNLVEDIFVWDLQLSSLGAKIITNRFKTLERINLVIEEKYCAVSSKTKDSLKLNYQSSTEFDGDETVISSLLLNKLNSKILKDSIIGHTTCGPHRDDIEFRLNHQNASVSASRGEARSIIIAIKLIEIDETIRIYNQQPIVLLDDIYSELDSTRQTKLKGYLKDMQVIVTGV